jgi:chitin disaccharide deacetylase
VSGRLAASGPLLKLLGFPKDARLLIINADDFGSCHANNAAILEGLTRGIVSSTTVMTPCPGTPEALRMLQRHRGIACGVHLTLISELASSRWGPLSSGDDVSSLIDGDGYFHGFHTRDELLAQARIAEVEREFRAQIDRVLDAGLQPTHLDWHCLLEGGRDDILQLTIRLALEYGLAMRVHRATTFDALMRRGLPASDHPTHDTYGIDAATKAERYAAMLRELPIGLSEWTVHPGLGTEESRALEPDHWRTRRADYEFVLSPEARCILADEGIRLISYRDLQPFWRDAA